MDKPKEIKRAVEIEELTNRGVIHPISAKLVPILHRMDVHPNTVSLAGALSGALAALCYHFYGSTAAVVAGFLLMIGWHVLDGADGQLARLSGKVTASGYVIDGICDYTTFIFVYLAIAFRLAALHGGAIWILVVTAGASHIIQSAAFELQRDSYKRWTSGDLRVAIASNSAGSPHGIFRLLGTIYGAVQEPFRPIPPALGRRLAQFGCGSDAARAQVAQKYREIFRTGVLRWSCLSANNRTIVIFLTCLAGRPWLYFLFELTVLNGALYLLVRMNRRQARRVSEWLNARGA